MLKNTSDVSYRYGLQVSLELCRIYLGDCHCGLKDFKKSGSGSIRKTMGYIKLWLGLTEDVENKPYLVVSETKNELSNEMRLKI